MKSNAIEIPIPQVNVSFVGAEMAAALKAAGFEHPDHSLISVLDLLKALPGVTLEYTRAGVFFVSERDSPMWGYKHESAAEALAWAWLGRAK